MQTVSARLARALLTRVRGARGAHGGAADGTRTPRTGTVWPLSHSLLLTLSSLPPSHTRARALTRTLPHSLPPLNHTPQFHLIQLKPQLAETYLGGAGGVCGGGRFNGAWSGCLCADLKALF